MASRKENAGSHVIFSLQYSFINAVQPGVRKRKEEKDTVSSQRTTSNRQRNKAIVQQPVTYNSRKSTPGS